MKANILVIDDEKSIRNSLKEFLLKEEYDVSAAKDFDEAFEIADTKSLDLILADIILGDKTGIDVLKKVKEKDLECAVVLFTGYPNIETASEAVRLGAFDYLVKPIKKETLLRIVRMALRHRAIIGEKNKYRANLEAIFKSVKDAIITVNKDMKVIEVNEAAESICSFSREEIVGKSFNPVSEMCGRQCIEAVKKTIKERQSIEIYRSECKHKTHEGQIVSINTFPFIDNMNGFSGCVMIAKDESHVADLEKELEERHSFSNIIGKSKEMQEVYSLIENLFNIDTTVLITGENGTGKGLVAEALHYGGVRRQRPFVNVNCSALPETLLESELFGHSKGAFTGAVTDRVGRFKKADGGTVFLDEIGDIPLRMQLRLLRVLQDKEFERIGDSTPIKVDVRIVAATNQDLQKKVRKGEFREDLYYRLKVVELSLPPLRDREEDIPIIVKYFIKKFNRKLKKNIRDTSNEVQKIFMDYNWPGNVRELENTIEHSFITCSKALITVDDLPREFKEMKTAAFVDGKSDEYNAILQALEKTHWNKTKAASLLSITRRTIYNKIKEFNIQ